MCPLLSFRHLSLIDLGRVSFANHCEPKRYQSKQEKFKQMERLQYQIDHVIDCLTCFNKLNTQFSLSDL